MRFFRRGAHHQTGFRPTVDDLAAAIKRQAERARWRVETHGGIRYFVTTCRVTQPVHGVPPGAVLTIAPEGGIATLPAIYDEQEPSA